jgi:hypothetical protein
MVKVLTLLLLTMPYFNLAQANSRVWAPVVDHVFISKAVGQTVVFNDPNPPIGVPNCVATALRAGGYLPGFALYGTDSFYENEVPNCFRKLNTKTEEPREGDIGIIYVPKIPTLAHAVLFLSDDKVFEKPSPLEKDPFQYNSWRDIVANNKSFDDSFRAEVWRFVGGKNCIFSQINSDLNRLKNDYVFSAAVDEIDARIYSGDWTSPSAFLSKENIQLALKSDELLLKKWFLSLRRPFDLKKDYNEYRKLNFKTHVLNLLLHTPAFQ